MDASIRKSRKAIHRGFAEIKNFDRVLITGDLDGAAERLVTLWNRLSEPTQIITSWQDGEFWRDWMFKQPFEENLKIVHDLLNDADQCDTLETLEYVREYLHANFSLLNDAVRHICADVGYNDPEFFQVETWT